VRNDKFLTWICTEILKATKVVVVRQKGYVNVESADRIESDDSEP